MSATTRQATKHRRRREEGDAPTPRCRRRTTRVEEGLVRRANRSGRDDAAAGLSVGDLQGHRQLLADVARIYERVANRPEPFNVFAVLRSASDEVNLHSRFLQAVLDHTDPQSGRRDNLREFVSHVANGAASTIVVAPPPSWWRGRVRARIALGPVQVRSRAGELLGRRCGEARAVTAGRCPTSRIRGRTVRRRWRPQPPGYGR